MAAVTVRSTALSIQDLVLELAGSVERIRLPAKAILPRSHATPMATRHDDCLQGARDRGAVYSGNSYDRNRFRTMIKLCTSNITMMPST